MGNTEFEELAKDLIQKWYKNQNVELDPKKDIYMVWVCKTLQNNKGLFSTTELDNRYFEITHNGDSNEIYFDSYIKDENICYVCPKFDYPGLKDGVWISEEDLKKMLQIKKDILKANDNG